MKGSVALFAACLALSCSAPAGAIGRIGSVSAPPAPPHNITPPPPAPPAPLPANDTNGTATCFLNQFRSFTPTQAQAQGVNIEKMLAHKLSVGSVAFSIAMMVFGALMLAAGWKLFTLV